MTQDKQKRIKRVREALQEYKLWFVVLLLTDVICALFLWLADLPIFPSLAGLLFFSSAAVFCFALFMICRREERREKLYGEFLSYADAYHMEQASEAVNSREKRQIQAAAALLKENAARLSSEKMKRRDYEEYIESWAHEIKTPLSLVALMLDSRNDEMSEEVRTRLTCAQIQMQQDVEQILCYSRLKSDHKDYVMEKCSLSDCCREAFDEYESFLQAYDFRIKESYGEDLVLTDRKGILFMLGQIFSNTVKYRKTDGTQPEISIETGRDPESNCVTLTVADNGTGVMGQDLPFIFDKGFCSENGETGRKSTGMGLYLVKQMAEDLYIETEAESEYGEGFLIRLTFPDFRKECNKTPGR